MNLIGFYGRKAKLYFINPVNPFFAINQTASMLNKTTNNACKTNFSSRARVCFTQFLRGVVSVMKINAIELKKKQKKKQEKG